QLLAARQTFGLTFLRLELKAACRIQNRTAAVNNLRNAADIHLITFAVDQTIISALNAHHAVAFPDTRTDDCTYSGIHAGRVTATGQNTDCFDFLSHKATPPVLEHSVT